MPQTHLPPYWKERFLAVIGGTKTKETLKLLDAWSRAEGGSAKWNPLNCVMDLPDATNYNTIAPNVHVKNYPRATWGICAQALTISNGQYNGILGDLQNGGFSAKNIVVRNRDEFSHWGTDPDLLLRVIGD